MGWELLLVLLDHPVDLALHANPPVPAAGTRCPAAGGAAGACLLPKQRRENC